MLYIYHDNMILCVVLSHVEIDFSSYMAEMNFEASPLPTRYGKRNPSSWV